MKRYHSLFVLAVTAAIVSSACSKNDEVPPPTAPAGSLAKQAPASLATRVEVATLTNGSAAASIVRPAEVQGGRQADLASALGGFVEAVLVESGARVKQGQTIARVDAGTYVTQVELAQVEVEDAERELDRLKQLGKAIASARVDGANTRVRRARAQLRLAQINAQRTVIRAPFAGVLSNLTVERGEVVAPGAVVGRLVQLDPAILSVSVTDADVGSLRVGAPAQAMASGSVTPIPGVISKIEPVADPNTRTFLVEVEVPNAKNVLLPGMIAAVNFVRETRSDLPHIPQDFIVTKLDGNGVFTVGDNDTAHWQPLDLGEIVGNLVQVKSGLALGARLIVTGHRSLADGDKLLITREGNCCVDGRVDFGAAPAADKSAATKTVGDNGTNKAKQTHPAGAATGGAAR